MTDIEQRLFFLEQLMTRLDQQMQNLKLQLQSLANAQRQMSPGQSGGGGGSSQAYFVNPTQGINGASGPPGVNSTPGGPLTAQSIYLISGGAFTLVTAAGSVLNGLQAPIVAGHGCVLLQNPDGTYSTASQSCV